MNKVIRILTVPVAGMTLSITLTRQFLTDNTALTPEQLDIPDDLLLESLEDFIDGGLKIDENLSSLASYIECNIWEWKDKLEKERIRDMPKNDLPLLVGHEFESNENEKLWEKRLRNHK